MEKTYYCPICGEVTHCPHYDQTRKPKKKKGYDGIHCPYCKSANTISLEQAQMDGPHGTQKIECLSCNKKWYDILGVIGWEEIG